MWRPEARSDGLSEDQERELAALDRLLGDPAGRAEDETGLWALVVAVRDDRPPLPPDFAAELDARVAAGFPRRAAPAPQAGEAGSAAEGTGRAGRLARTAGRVGAGRWLTGLGGRWLTGLGATAAVAAAIAVVVVASAGRPASGGGGTAGRIQDAAPRSPASGGPAIQTPAPGGAATGAAAGGKASAGRVPAAPTPSSTATTAPAPAQTPGPVPTPIVPALGSPSGGARVVARDATLGLLAPRGQVQAVTDRAIAATDRLGGIVESSQVALDDQGSSQASLELQVPSAALDRTLAALSALAHVSARTQNALDITDPTGAARDRLAQTRAERQALLRQLARATTANELASLRARLALVGGRIASDEAQLQALLTRGQFSHVSVTIAESQQSAGGGAGRSGWGPGAALDDALGVLEAVFAVLVVALAGLVPVVIVAGLGWAAVRPVRRRRREAAIAGPG